MILDQSKIRRVERSRPASGNEAEKLQSGCSGSSSMVQPAQSTAPTQLPRARTVMPQLPPTSPYSLPSEPLYQHSSRHVEPNCKQLASNSDGGTGLRQGWAYEKQQQQQNNNCNKKTPSRQGENAAQFAQRRALEGGVGSAVAFLRAWSITHILAEAVTESTWCTGLGR